jgi:hypothetical protein
LDQSTLINKRKKALLPVVLQRQTLADALARYLGQLGLERKAKALSLQDILAQSDESETNGATTHNEPAGEAKDETP